MVSMGPTNSGVQSSTPGQINKILQEYKDRLKTVRRKLTEIEMNPFYEYHRNGGRSTGYTEYKLNGIRRDMGRADDIIVVVSAVITKADDIKKTIWSWTPEGVSGINGLLLGRVSTTSYNYASLGDALDMVDTLVSNIIASLAELNEAKEKAMVMYLHCCDLLGDLPSKLAEDLNIKAAMLYSEMDEDPLGAEERFHKSVKIQADLLKAQVNQYKSVPVVADSALSGLNQLELNFPKIKAEIDACKVKISGVGFYAVSEDDISGLRTWLARIQKTLSEGNFQAGQHGLVSWQRSFDNTKAFCDNNVRLAQGNINRREELRSRFGALVAKRQALKLQGKVLEVEKTLKSYLFETVTPIEETETLFKEYTTLLVERKTL